MKQESKQKHKETKQNITRKSKHTKTNKQNKT